MYNSADLYDLTQALSGAIFGALAQAQQEEVGSGDPAPEESPLFALRRGRAESPGWFLIQALEFDPEPVSVARLRVRDIYASERIVFALLVLMSSEKWLETVAEDEYVLSSKGRAVVEARIGRTRTVISNLEKEFNPLPIQRLESLLGQIIVASQACDNPPGNWCLRYSRNRAPGLKASPLVKIHQYTADFNAFRDDAHMAAWRPQSVAGYAWEAFAFVCDGAADSAAAIDQLLSYRGYSTGEYESALTALVERGWLERIPGETEHYRPTELGRDTRREVEQLTNQYFYDPWRQLDDESQRETVDLMKQLKQELQAAA